MKKVGKFLVSTILLIIVVYAITKGILTISYPEKLVPIIVAIQIAVILGIFYVLIKKTQNIGGPYFQGQTPAHCGHYYPDVVLLRDKLELKNNKHIRVLHCVFCGEYSVPLGFEIPLSLRINPVPTDEWREQARRDLQDSASRRFSETKIQQV